MGKSSDNKEEEGPIVQLLDALVREDELMEAVLAPLPESKIPRELSQPGWRQS